MLLSKQKGFTLIELMIVLAIIGILVAIAIPAYQDYIRHSANSACLIEVKSYANKLLIAHANHEAAIPAAPAAPAAGASACAGYANVPATIADIITTANLTGNKKTPGDKDVVCNLVTGGTCILVAP